MGYGPTLAEVLLRPGQLAQRRRPGGRRRSRASKRRSGARSWPATTRSPRRPRRTSSTRTGYLQARFDLAETWCRHTEMLLRRMGEHDDLWGWYLNNRADDEEGAGQPRAGDRRRARGDRRQGTRLRPRLARRRHQLLQPVRVSRRGRLDHGGHRGLRARHRDPDSRARARASEDGPRALEPRRVAVPDAELRRGASDSRRERSRSSSGRRTRTGPSSPTRCGSSALCRLQPGPVRPRAARPRTRPTESGGARTRSPSELGGGALRARQDVVRRGRGPGAGDGAGLCARGRSTSRRPGPRSSTRIWPS